MNGIWVRTQDKKRLVNCKDIEAVGGTVISNYDKEDYFKLGVYQTNERALEVLDSIQSHINNGYITVTENDGYGRVSTRTINDVYEMPKE